jgi:hypothetical protein
VNPGWRKHDRFCYYYNDTDIVDFHTAWERCDQEKAKLVSILSEKEQAYVNTMVGGYRRLLRLTLCFSQLIPHGFFAVLSLYFTAKTFMISIHVSSPLIVFY